MTSIPMPFPKTEKEFVLRLKALKHVLAAEGIDVRFYKGADGEDRVTVTRRKAP